MYGPALARLQSIEPQTEGEHTTIVLTCFSQIAVVGDRPFFFRKDQEREDQNRLGRFICDHQTV